MSGRQRRQTDASARQPLFFSLPGPRLSVNKKIPPKQDARRKGLQPSFLPTMERGSGRPFVAKTREIREKPLHYASDEVVKHSYLASYPLRTIPRVASDILRVTCGFSSPTSSLSTSPPASCLLDPGAPFAAALGAVLLGDWEPLSSPPSSAINEGDSTPSKTCPEGIAHVRHIETMDVQVDV